MKKYIYGVAVLIVTLSVVGLTVTKDSYAVSIHSNTSDTSADATAHNAAVQAVDAVSDAITTFIDQVNKITSVDDSAQIEASIASGKDLQEKITALNQHSFTLDASASYQNAASAVQAAATELATATRNANDALASGDSDTINASLQQFDKAASAYDTSVATLNTAIDEHNAPIIQEQKNTGILYIIVSIVAIIATIATFAWRPRNETKHQKALRINAGYQSFWPLGGALITTIWFFSSDGEYLILWGAILFGFIIYIRALWTAITARKNAHKDIAAFTTSYARESAVELANTLGVNKDDVPSLTLLMTLDLESLYDFSVLNFTKHSNQEYSRKTLSLVESEINRLASIDGSARETKEAREKISHSITQTVSDQNESENSDKRSLAVLGATNFLLDEYPSTTQKGKNFDENVKEPIIKKLSAYQQAIAQFI